MSVVLHRGGRTATLHVHVDVTSIATQIAAQTARDVDDSEVQARASRILHDPSLLAAALSAVDAEVRALAAEFARDLILAEVDADWP